MLALFSYLIFLNPLSGLFTPSAPSTASRIDSQQDIERERKEKVFGMPSFFPLLLRFFYPADESKQTVYSTDPHLHLLLFCF